MNQQEKMQDARRILHVFYLQEIYPGADRADVGLLQIKICRKMTVPAEVAPR